MRGEPTRGLPLDVDLPAPRVVQLSLTASAAAAVEWDGGLVWTDDPTLAGLGAELARLGAAAPCLPDPRLPLALRRHAQVVLHAGVEVDDALARLSAWPGVAAALEGNLARPASPSDPLVDADGPDAQWYLDAIRARQAWTRASGAGVRVAVIDLGFDTTHPDLAANLLLDQARDFSNPSTPDLIDDGDRFHGTASASLLAAPANSVGMVGVAYDAKVLPYQWRTHASTDEVPFETAIANAIVHAADLPQAERPQVILPVIHIIGRGTIEYYPLLRDAVEYAVDAGVHVVLPAGNSARGIQRARSYDTGSIIVGAGSTDDELLPFSNHGERIDLLAPGLDLVVANAGGGYDSSFWGTSAASPIVAGVVALMLEVDPSLAPRELRRRLRASARPAAAYPVLDAERAVELAAIGTAADDLPGDPSPGAPLLELGQPVEATLEFAGDEDAFRFEVSGADVQWLRLEFPAGAIPGATLVVLGPDGRTRHRPWDRERTTAVRYDTSASPPGTYFVRVRSKLGHGPYRLVHTLDAATPAPD